MQGLCLGLSRRLHLAAGLQASKSSTSGKSVLFQISVCLHSLEACVFDLCCSDSIDFIVMD